MKTYSFYNKDTGYFIDKKINTNSEDILLINTGENEVAVEGDHDHLSKRFDIEKGEIVDYQPPQPSDDHEWIEEEGRWQVKQEVQEHRRQRAQALIQLQQLDAKHLRALDEVHADPTNVVAIDNLAAIRKLKEQLRKKLV